MWVGGLAPREAAGQDLRAGMQGTGHGRQRHQRRTGLGAIRNPGPTLVPGRGMPPILAGQGAGDPVL